MTLPSRSRLFWLYGAASLAAVFLGSVICMASGVGSASWARNFVAWGLGLALAVGFSLGRADRVMSTVVGLAVVALIASLFGPPQDGVRRWLDVGPLHINVAFVVLPTALVAMAVQRGWVVLIAVPLVILCALAVQPDASQATAFAAATAVIVMFRIPSMPVRLAMMAGMAVLVVVTWLRPDPLASVPEVEEILALAYGLSPALAFLGVGLIAATATAPALAVRSAEPDARAAGYALTTYIAVCAAVTVAEAFPMPLLGVGMSPIVGFWLAIGLLAAWLRRLAVAPAASRASGS